MNYFLKANKSLIVYSFILIVIPIFGIRFFINLLGNVLLLLVLIPVFILLIAFIGFSYYKSKLKTCSNCGAISLGSSETCMNCGAGLDYESNGDKLDKNASESTIEVKAEEIK